MVATKDRPHGPGRSVPMLIVVDGEDHLAIQAPRNGSTLFWKTDRTLETRILLFEPKFKFFKDRKI